MKRVFISGGGLLLVMVQLQFTNVPLRLNVLDVFARSEKVLGFRELLGNCVHLRLQRENKYTIYVCFANWYGSDWFLEKKYLVRFY